jgi:hypothetical protein
MTDLCLLLHVSFHPFTAEAGLEDGDAGDAEGTYLNRDASAVLFNSLAAVHIAAADRMRQVRFAVISYCFHERAVNTSPLTTRRCLFQTVPSAWVGSSSLVTSYLHFPVAQFSGTMKQAAVSELEGVLSEISKLLKAAKATFRKNR